MVSAETAQEWLAASKADERMKAWIAEAETAYRLDVTPDDGEGWYSEVENGVAKIGMGETERPLPSFAHEILHVCLSARGYKHIVTVGNVDRGKAEILKQLLGSLDNELQHHRMFDEFTTAGFDGADFYHDGDAVSHLELATRIKSLPITYPPIMALFLYLSLLAPGGRWPEGEREKLTQLLQNHVPAATWGKLQTISGIIDLWKQQVDLDPTKTVAAIVEALDDFDYTFVGENGSYPNGAFIPNGLTQEQFEAHLDAAHEAKNGQ